jgi:hypothetical protein
MKTTLNELIARPITKTDIEAVRTASVWDLGNRVLYDLCDKYPRHRAAEEIIAKIWLIGRAYAASIERRRNADLLGDGFYESTVAPAMMKAAIDEWLAGIQKEETQKSSMAIAVHKQLMDLFADITELEKRSLASKYLHFHMPDVFFLYDSRARRAITKVVPRLNKIPHIHANTYDKEYKDFVRRCLWMRNDICSTHGIVLTPREIDKLLLTIAAENNIIAVAPNEALQQTALSYYDE